jgi:hypothetical protein
MNRRAAVLAVLTLPFGARPFVSAGAPRRQAPWTPLFNGRNLTGWDTWLGKPHRLTDVPGLARNQRGEYEQPIGLNRDPRGVFSIVQVDEAPAVRISGETYGGLITREEYENYHLRFEFKWGTKRWPPREHAVRDTGCCYHSVGPNDASYGFWMKSFEFQIQEGDCGDFYSLAGVMVDAEAVHRDSVDAKSDLMYRRGSPTIAGATRRIVKDRDNERPAGEWNSMELYCLGQTSVHVVNGRANMVLTALRHRVDGRDVPLTRVGSSFSPRRRRSSIGTSRSGRSMRSRTSRRPQ